MSGSVKSAHLAEASRRFRGEIQVGLHPVRSAGIAQFHHPARSKIHGFHSSHQMESVVHAARPCRRKRWISKSANCANRPVAGRPFQQGIVDVGDVLHVAHGVTGGQPEAMDRVEEYVGGRMADMGGVVRRYSADVT